MTYCALMVLDIPGNLIFSSPCPKRLVVMSLAYILRYTISFCFLYIDLRYEKFPTVRKMHPILSKMCRCKENYILLFDLTLLFGEYGLKHLQRRVLFQYYCSNIPLWLTISINMSDNIKICIQTFAEGNLRKTW